MEIRRKVKNVVYKYSEPERLVREATSNDPWGPTTTVMSEIADITYDIEAFDEIMQIIWKRLNDKGKNWRHVYKCLILLDYLIKCGNERVSTVCSSNIHAIETLKDFQYFEEYKDLGLGVREKSKSLVTLLRDDEVLSLERQKGQLVREKFQGPKDALGNKQRRRPGDLGREIRKQHLDKESRIPKSVMKLNFDQDKNDDEDENYKKAIALSKVEHEISVKKKLDEEKLEDKRIKYALEQSKKEDEALSVLRPPPKNNDVLMSMDLLSLSIDLEPEINTISKISEASRMVHELNGFDHVDVVEKCDPWGESKTNNIKTNVSLNFDPWATGTDFTAPKIIDKPVDYSVWPIKEKVQNEGLLDVIFGDSNPNIVSHCVWNGNNRNTPFPTKEDNERNLFDSVVEADMTTCHSSNNVTGSLASLTDIGMRNQDDQMQHSHSVMNLSPHKTKKTPQQFLGINANLINLENLLPTPKAGVYRDASSYAQKNPFGVNKNPFNSLTVQNKMPMNQMAAGSSPNYTLSTPGNVNMNSMHAQLPPQSLGLAFSTNIYTQGGTSWTSQPPTVPSTLWVSHANSATPNPFFN